MKFKWTAGVPVIAVPLLVLAFTAKRQAVTAPPLAKLNVPAAAVKRGDVVFTVTAKGELQGGNSEMLVAPMTGGASLVITKLLENGEKVEPDEEVVEFDTTEQEFNLREAEADLAEAEQQVIQSKADNAARESETQAQLILARTNLRVAELECRRNELYARIAARRNELALEAAKERLRQLESDLANRKATAAAGVAINEAARAKAKVKAEIARKNIDAMTLKAKSEGYVAIQQNNDGAIRWGMQVPVYQEGDTVRPGMAVAQIPDTKSWEGIAKIGELDRGHLALGQNATLEVVALPGKTFRGKVKVIGGTTGPPWNRSFDCRVSVDDATAELRPGLSLVIRVETGQMKDVLWIPAQALFENGGKTLVYVRSGDNFVAQQVKLERRGEEKAVITGLKEGQQVALASPDQVSKSKEGAKGAVQAVTR